MGGSISKRKNFSQSLSHCPRPNLFDDNIPNELATSQVKSKIGHPVGRRRSVTKNKIPNNTNFNRPLPRIKTSIESCREKKSKVKKRFGKHKTESEIIQYTDCELKKIIPFHSTTKNNIALVRGSRSFANIQDSTIYGTSLYERISCRENDHTSKIIKSHSTGNLDRSNVVKCTDNLNKQNAIANQVNIAYSKIATPNISTFCRRPIMSAELFVQKIPGSPNASKQLIVEEIDDDYESFGDNNSTNENNAYSTFLNKATCFATDTKLYRKESLLKNKQNVLSNETDSQVLIKKTTQKNDTSSNVAKSNYHDETKPIKTESQQNIRKEDDMYDPLICILEVCRHSLKLDEIRKALGKNKPLKKTLNIEALCIKREKTVKLIAKRNMSAKDITKLFQNSGNTEIANLFEGIAELIHIVKLATGYSNINSVYDVAKFYDGTGEFQIEVLYRHKITEITIPVSSIKNPLDLITADDCKSQYCPLINCNIFDKWLPVISADLAGQELLEKHCKMLANLISKLNPFLEELSLSGNTISCISLKSILEAINKTNYKKLQILDLSRTCIADSGVMLLINMLKSGFRIGALNLDGCRLTKSSIEPLLQLYNNTNSPLLTLPTCLDLSDNNLSSINTNSIGDLLLTSECPLKKLKVMNCNLHEHTVSQIITHMGKNKNVDSLYLRGNVIPLYCFENLKDSVLKNTNLKELSLSRTDMAENGVKQLATALQTNNSLSHLDISMNCLGDQGALEISRMLRVNTGLIYLDLTKCGIGNIGLLALLSSLYINEYLLLIKLGYNKFGQLEEHCMSRIEHSKLQVVVDESLLGIKAVKPRLKIELSGNQLSAKILKQFE